MKQSTLSPFTRNDRVNKMIVAMLIPGALGLLFFIYLHFSETGKFPLLKGENSAKLISSILIGAALGLTLYIFNKQLDQWIPWRKQYSIRFLLGYATNVIISLIICVGLGLVLISFSGEGFFWKGLSRQDADLIWKIIILMLTSLFIYNVVYAMLYSYQHYAVAQIESLQNERKQLELQFEALKSQISPHYLFNSLNAISSLIFKDLPSAEQFIRRLAQTYQYILGTQNKKFVLLREEVDFVQSYYYLLRIRFQQQLNVEINLPSGIMNSKIPPLTLQILVENAVKHNTLGNDNKLFIYITAQDNTHLKIINTKTNAFANVHSFKVGLDNIKKRYQYFTDKPIEVRDEDKFIVSLPVILQKHDPIEQKYSA